jgi:hypothetical protein
MTAMGTTGANPFGWPRARDDCAIAGATVVPVAAAVAVTARASARAARLASGVTVVAVAAAAVVCAALVSAA